jgi:hypothetical protein
VIVGEIVAGSAIGVGAPVPVEEPPDGAAPACANAVAGKATAFAQANQSTPTTTADATLALLADRLALAPIIQK